MESLPEAVSPALELDTRSMFAAKLATLATGQPGSETVQDKKRESFLTRTFFGRKEPEKASPMEDHRATAAEPSAQAVSASPPSDPVNSEHTPPSATNTVADAPGEFSTPRITVPTFEASPIAMTPNPTTHASPPAGQASAQLTLGFEVTSLQLSPFFRLGAVQLRAISNVASLQLVAAGHQDQPLAAGISFEIERVELNEGARLKSIVLKPLGESREEAVPASRLQVDAVALAGKGADMPISVTASGAVPTVVQLVGTFAIAAMEFSPAFEIDSLRLEPAADMVLLRVAPAAGPGERNLPSSFEIAEVQLDDDSRVRGARLVPSMAGHA